MVPKKWKKSCFIPYIPHGFLGWDSSPLPLRCASCDAGYQLIDKKCTFKAFRKPSMVGRSPEIDDFPIGSPIQSSISIGISKCHVWVLEGRRVRMYFCIVACHEHVSTYFVFRDLVNAPRLFAIFWTIPGHGSGRTSESKYMHSRHCWIEFVGRSASAATVWSCLVTGGKQFVRVFWPSKKVGTPILAPFPSIVVQLLAGEGMSFSHDFGLRESPRCCGGTRIFLLLSIRTVFPMKMIHWYKVVPHS